MALKAAMLSALVLAYPDFEKEFVVETNACTMGIVVVLSQNEHPICYYSCKLLGKMKNASIYVKKMFAISQAVSKWRHYLLGKHFPIRIDHKSLKNILSQVIQTLEQQTFLFKLLGFNYTIEYRSGKENNAADALSRVMEEEEEILVKEGSMLALLVPMMDILAELRRENANHSFLLKMRLRISENEVPARYSINNDWVMFK